MLVLTTSCLIICSHRQCSELYTLFNSFLVPGQMSLWQLEYVKDGPRNLPLKFGQNRVSNSWDIADIEFLWVGWVGVYSHFRVKPPTTMRLGCRWVGVMTIFTLGSGNPPLLSNVEQLGRAGIPFLKCCCPALSTCFTFDTKKKVAHFLPAYISYWQVGYQWVNARS